MQKKKHKIFTLAMLAALAACDQVDCTLYNIVSYTCGLYAGGSAVTLNDKLTVTAFGTDSVLVNGLTGQSSVTLPMSLANEADTLVLQVEGEDYVLRDTVRVEKTNVPHFESPDCPTRMFHQITSVSTSHNFIDSITVVNSQVNYSNVENIQIHLYAAE